MRRAKITLAAILAATALIIAGCGSNSGNTSAKSATIPVDISRLDTGGFRTTPVKFNRLSLGRAKMSEGQSLASYLPLPMDIDPSFKFQEGTSSTMIFGFTAEAQGTGLDSNNLDTDAPGFVAGFNVEAQNDKDILIATTLHYSVLIFTDADSASNGMAVLAKKEFDRHPGNQLVQIDGYPETNSFWWPDEDGIKSFTASGQYGIYTSIYDNATAEIKSTDLPALTALAAKTVYTVEPKLKDFKPTPVDQLENIEIDNDGMLGHTLFKNIIASTSVSSGVGRSPTPSNAPRRSTPCSRTANGCDPKHRSDNPTSAQHGPAVSTRGARVRHQHGIYHAKHSADSTAGGFTCNIAGRLSRCFVPIPAARADFGAFRPVCCRVQRRSWW
jgi:hypothetical protein